MSKSITYYQNSRPEVFSLIPFAPNRVLEIGCAAGRFRENFSGQLEYWGVEPVEIAAAEAKKKGIITLVGNYNSVSAKIPDGYFDVIVCNDVIEHIWDTSEFLSSLAKKLNANGIVVGSVPNVRFWGNLINLLLHREWKYEDSGVLDDTHVRFFTVKSFRRTLVANGFSVDVIRGIESVRMKILKMIFAPLLAVFGFDICYMQFVFRVSCPVLRTNQDHLRTTHVL